MASHAAMLSTFDWFLRGTGASHVMSACVGVVRPGCGVEGQIRRLGRVRDDSERNGTTTLQAAQGGADEPPPSVLIGIKLVGPTLETCGRMGRQYLSARNGGLGSRTCFCIAGQIGSRRSGAAVASAAAPAHIYRAKGVCARQMGGHVALCPACGERRV